MNATSRVFILADCGEKTHGSCHRLYSVNRVLCKGEGEVAPWDLGRQMEGKRSLKAEAPLLHLREGRTGIPITERGGSTTRVHLV